MECSTGNIIITILSLFHPFVPYYDAMIKNIFNYTLYVDEAEIGFHLFCESVFFGTPGGLPLMIFQGIVLMTFVIWMDYRE